MAQELPSPAGPELLFGRAVYIETYGCRYNFGDTAKLVEILVHHHSTIVSTPEEADCIVINTCTVVGPTERRMLRRLARFRDRNLVVTGCMPAVQLSAIREVCDPIVILPGTIQEWYRKIGTVAGGEAGIVQVAQGCLGRCTYCLTRLARGPLHSFPRGEILSQVAAFAARGTAEIQLTAQDVSAWGRDAGETLPVLLREIQSVPPPAMIRVGMMNPSTVRDILDDLIGSFDNERIFRFIHLPVQSGSDRILARMGREYITGEYEEIVRSFRRQYPDITLITDIIVGFPGETGEDFQATLDLIGRIRPNKVNVTRYSRRPLTPISGERDFPDSVKKDRSRLVQAHAERIYAALNNPQVGTVIPFIVTETIRSGSVMARSPNYTGIVINEALPQGTTGRAVLTADHRYFFIGTRVL